MSIATISLTMLILMSIFSGMVISMTIYLMKRQIKGAVTASTSGVLFSLLTPTCPSCAIGLLSALGFGGFIAVLPFKGLELGVLGLIILIVSIIYLSNKIVSNVCEVRI